MTADAGGRCLNCDAPAMRRVRSVTVLRDQPAALEHCSACDFLGLADPHWLTRAYATPFFGDTGYVQRNLEQARFMRLLLAVHATLRGNGRLYRACDLGTGLGLFPRLMRDHGYDFWGTDAYAEMLLIRPFVDPPEPPPILTAFEVIEHVASLPRFLAASVRGAELLVCSTLLRPDGEVPPPTWWYYAHELGQHISFHSRRSFREALRGAGLPETSLISVTDALHVCVFAPDWRLPVAIAARLHRSPLLRPVGAALTRLRARPSLTWPDHLQAMRALGREDVTTR
jgi:hypothetical protein